MKKKMLFVTYLDEHPEAGFSYVIELAKVMNEDLMVFLLREKRMPGDDDQVELTDASGNGPEGLEVSAPETEKKLAGLVYKCKRSGVNVDLLSLDADVVSAIEDYFRHRNGIDIVLLGPNISEHSRISQRTLKRLSDAVARPIVTMANQSTASPL
ncbi:MAG TPA: hypothetical protein VK435_03785 [Thermodesulfovibrionales bacterium]|nr:hypothetical protein [Thermodesulfovibrionales bacterium]